jgi:hypothetical protein
VEFWDYLSSHAGSIFGIAFLAASLFLLTKYGQKTDSAIRKSRLVKYAVWFGVTIMILFVAFIVAALFGVFGRS